MGYAMSDSISPIRNTPTERVPVSRRHYRRVAAFTSLTLLIAACGIGGASITTSTTAPTTSTTSTTSTTMVDPCPLADAGLSEKPASGLPQAVDDARSDVIKAALECDYETLANLARASEFGFTFGDGAEGDPVEYWKNLKGGEFQALEYLVTVLNMSFGEKETQFETDVYTQIYVWPAVFGEAEEPSDADWDELKSLYSDEEIAQMRSTGFYGGWRTAFTEDGQWVFFVAGD